MNVSRWLKSKSVKLTANKVTEFKEVVVAPEGIESLFPPYEAGNEEIYENSNLFFF